MGRLLFLMEGGWLRSLLVISPTKAGEKEMWISAHSGYIQIDSSIKHHKTLYKISIYLVVYILASLSPIYSWLIAACINWLAIAVTGGSRRLPST